MQYTRGAGIVLTFVLLFCGPYSLFAASAVHTEDGHERNLERSAPIPRTTITQLQQKPTAARSSAVQSVNQPNASTTGANLISNPSVETTSSSSPTVPTKWFKGGYGSNTRVLTYPVPGSAGTSSRALSVSMGEYTTGDVKWYFEDVPVAGGKEYQFSDVSTSSAPSIIDIRFKLSDGTFAYKDVLTVTPSDSFQTNTATFTAPANAVSLTVFHLLKQVGALTTDEYSLQEIVIRPPPPPPPPPSDGNFILNGDLETGSNSGTQPASWNRGGYGSNTRTFAYPALGKTGRGAMVTISNYVSGDAKWYFDPITLAPGMYKLKDSYMASTSSYVTLQFRTSSGTISYKDLGTLPAASVWTDAAFVFQMPPTAQQVTVFHLIKGNGSITIDDASITKQNTFAAGALSFRFDDGLDNQYSIAAPKLDSAGFKGTFYIVSEQILDNDYSGFMSIANIRSLANRGHEIGAHTRTHPHLPDLMLQEQQSEIEGSRNDILAWNVGPVLAFCYPYGEYETETLGVVAQAGFTSAAATISGYVTPGSDHYQLEYQEVRQSTTIGDVKRWVDTAATDHTWLILTFHGIDTTGDFYSTTPTLFGQIVDYVKQKGIPVVTVTQGMQSM